MSPPTVGQARCYSLMRLLERHLRRLENFHEVAQGALSKVRSRACIAAHRLKTVVIGHHTALQVARQALDTSSGCEDPQGFGPGRCDLCQVVLHQPQVAAGQRQQRRRLGDQSGQRSRRSFVQRVPPLRHMASHRSQPAIQIRSRRHGALIGWDGLVVADQSQACRHHIPRSAQGRCCGRRVHDRSTLVEAFSCHVGTGRPDSSTPGLCQTRQRGALRQHCHVYAMAASLALGTTGDDGDSYSHGE